MKDRRVTVKFEEEFYNKLKANADKMGLSLSAYIRLTLSKEINKENDKK